MRRVFRNGTIALYQYNGLFYAFNKFEKYPSSLYVDCSNSDYGYLTTRYDASPLPTEEVDYIKLLAPVLSTASTNVAEDAANNVA